MKHQEIISIKHKGITIALKIDYDAGLLSIVEKDSNNTVYNAKFVQKSWIFKERGLEYMEGWQNILDAMKYAIGKGTEMLKTELEERNKIREDAVVEALKAQKNYEKTPRHRN